MYHQSVKIISGPPENAFNSIFLLADLFDLVLSLIFFIFLLYLFLKINKGDIEGEVIITGSSAAQQKAKELIEELLSGSNFPFGNGELALLLC